MIFSIFTEDNSFLKVGLGELSNSVRSSLSVDHDGESLKIGKVGAGLFLSELLGSGGGSPFLLKFEIPDSLENGGSSGTSEERDSQFGQSKSSDGVEDSGEAFSINENSVRV